MKTHDQATVAASPEEVWPYLADPDLIPLWNPKLVAIDHRGRGEVTLGDRFAATYRMSSKREPVWCEVMVTKAERPVAIEYEHTVDRAPHRFRVVESYRVEPCEGGALVTQSVDLSEALPWWIKPLVRLIVRTGKPVGPTAMELLAEAVEAGAAEAGSPTA